MSQQHHITQSCIISKNTVWLNGEPVFNGVGVSLPDFLLSVYRHFNFNYPRFHKMDNLSKLGWLTSELLLQKFEREKYEPQEVGLILSNANASIESDIKYLHSADDIPSPALFVYTLPNIVTGEICIRNNFKGEDAFFVSEQFDAGFTSRYVSGLLNNGILKTCICGWVDVLSEEYKSALFLVEQQPTQSSVIFDEQHLSRLFETDNKKKKDAPVFITGLGAVTAIGNNVAECLDAFQKERAGMAEIAHLNTIYKGRL